MASLHSKEIAIEGVPYLEALLVCFINLLRLCAQLLPAQQLTFQVLFARFSIESMNA